MIYTTKPVKDDYKAYLVNGAFFTKFMNYPIIEKWMLIDKIPKRMVPFDKIKEVKDLSNCAVCFYCADKELKKLKKNPQKYLKMFSKSLGIIGLDFSIHNDQPYPVQIKQMYNNLGYTYYYGLRLIPTVPNIRLGNDKISMDYYNAVPKNSIIAIGTYGFNKTTEEKERTNKFIDELIKYNNPKIILIYGSLSKYAKYKLKSNDIKYYCYKPWISKEDKGYMYDSN